MTLKELLEGKNNIFIKEYERYGNDLIFVGGTFYANKFFIPIDGSFFVLGLKPNAYEWKDNNTLMIVRQDMTVGKILKVLAMGTLFGSALK